ncbi:MAG TPA: hypothetical protein H9859_04590 [Candidatus Barnesiella excrementigallinarum]|nr:hypothetical protein [Candidatus Barnesiella excrementigallinarum]
MLDLISTVLPFLGSLWLSRNEREQSQQAFQEQQNRYQQDLSQLNTLFNRTYYGNLLDRSDVRGLLGNLRNQMMETTQELKNQASVTGATPELITAVQKAQNQAYGNAVGQVAQQATSWKENTLQNYLSARRALEEFYRPVKSNYMGNILGNTFSTFNSLKSLFQ